MKNIFLLFVSSGLLISSWTYGQSLESADGGRIVPEGLRISSSLYRNYKNLSVESKKNPTQQDIQKFKNYGITLEPNGMVSAKIQGQLKTDAATDLQGIGLEALGVKVGYTYDQKKAMSEEQLSKINRWLSCALGTMQIRVPVANLTKVAEVLPAGYYLRELLPLESDQEGPVVQNSQNYLAANNNDAGTGLTIAVIDSNWNQTNWNAAQAAGTIPAAANITTADLTGGAFLRGDRHGIGCLENLFAHAPGATYLAYRPNTFGDAIRRAVDDGANIISMSMSDYNEGWQDGTGDTCAAAQYASDNGVILFCAAGNRQLQHYQGVFNDSGTNTDGGDRHDFGGGDITLGLTFDSTLNRRFYLQWDNHDTDLDFFLYEDLPSGSVLRGSGDIDGAGQFEAIQYRRPNGSTNTNYHIRVVHMSGPTNVEFEVFNHNAGSFEFSLRVPENSNTVPSNSPAPLVISVGAVDHQAYVLPGAAAFPADRVTSYSSRGPSNSGMILPDICGPTRTAGVAYPSGFTGTSGACPNVAGMAAAFWSQNLNLSGEEVVWLMKEQAAHFRDWGIAGPDNRHGVGGAYLIDYAPNTFWMSRRFPRVSYTNSGISPSTELLLSVPDHSRVVAVGPSNFPDFPNTSSQRPVTIESIGGPVSIGTDDIDEWHFHPNAQGDDHFGNSVAISDDGEWAVVGAPRDDTSNGGNDAGSAVVYKKNSAGQWSHHQTLSLSQADNTGGDHFGHSVDISGDGTVIAIGAPQADTNRGDDAGAAWVYKLNTSSQAGGFCGFNTFCLDQKLFINNNSASGGDRFGWKVDISSDGNSLLVGAPFDDVPGNDDKGSIRVFVRSDNSASFGLQDTLYPPTSLNAEDRFGYSFGMSGNGLHLFVDIGLFAAPFSRAATNLNFQSNNQKFTGTTHDPESGQPFFNEVIRAFGEDIALNHAGDRAVIGFPREVTRFQSDHPFGIPGRYAGAAFIYERGVTGSWVEVERLTDPNGEGDTGGLFGGDQGDRFGSAVSINSTGDIVVIGAPRDDTESSEHFSGISGDDAGSVCVFSDQNGWGLLRKIPFAQNQVSGDQFGFSVAIDGDGLVGIAGAPKDDEFGNDSGSILIIKN